MSDTDQDREPDPTQTSHDEPAPVPTGKAKRKRRSWRRRLRWLLKWGAIGIVVARILLGLFLQPIVDFGASFAGLSVSWRSSSLSITGLSLRIEDLVVRDAADAAAPALLTAHELVADLSTRQLLTGQLAVVDAGLAGVRVTVHQLADGTLQLPKAWLEPGSAEPDPEPEPEVEEPQPLTFDLPFWIASTRLHDLQIDFVDHTQQPPKHHTGKLDFDLANVGFADRQGTVLLRLHVPELCDELFVQARIHNDRDRADVRFTTVVRGFRPHGFDLPTEVYDTIDDARVVDVRLTGDLAATTLPEAPTQPAVTGELNLGVALDGIERSSLAATFGPARFGGGSITTPFAVELQTDGVVESLRLQDGSLVHNDDELRADARLVVDSLIGKRLRPLLEAAGLQLPPKGLDIAAGFAARLGATQTIELNDVSIDHEDGEQLSLPKVHVRDLQTVDDELRIAAIEIVGPKVTIERAANGDMIFAGLRTTTPTTGGTAPAKPAATADASTPATATAATTLPKLRIGSLDWSGVQVAFRDASLEPAADLLLDQLHVHTDEFAIGADTDENELSLEFALPGAIEHLGATLRLRCGLQRVHAELGGQLDQITLTRLRPWLEPLGITPEFSAGTFQLQSSADVELLQGGIAASARLQQVRLHDGDTDWFSLGEVTGEGLRIDGDGLQIGTWTVRQPFVKLHQDEQQNLHVFGMMLGAAAPAAAPADPESATPPPAPPVESEASALPIHGPIELSDLRLLLSTHEQPGEQFTIGLDARVGANDGSGAAIPIAATVRLDQAVDRFQLDAELRQAERRLSLSGELDAAGIHGSRLAEVMPAGVTCTLQDGLLRAGFQAEIGTGAGAGIEARVRKLRLADGDDELAAVDDLSLIAPALAGDEVHIAEARITGIRASVAQLADALAVPGFSIATPAETAPAAPAPSGGNAPTTTERPPAAAPLQIPRLRIDALQVELDRFVFHDRRSPDSVPLELRNGVTLREPWIGDPTAERPQPMVLQVAGQCPPVGASWAAELHLHPFEITPTLDLHWQLQGFDTTRLANISPTLAAQLGGEATDLTCSGDLHVGLDLRRRDPALFDFNRPFGAELVLERFVLRDAATDQLYASITAIDAIARAVDPHTGSVLLRSLDIDEPIVRIRKDAAGTHAFGFLLPEPPPGEASTEPAGADEGGTREAPAPAPKNAPTDAGPEFAVDRLNLLGFGFDYRDQTTEPPTHIHLADSDVEVLRFTTRALRETLPVVFRAAVRGGDVELDRRIVRSSFLEGLVSSGVDALTGGSDRHERVQRPMLDQIEARGRLVLFPRPKGRVEIDVDRVELSAFRGLAKESGVDLSDGIYDADIDIDLLGADGLRIASEHVLTWLEMSEPADGPISTYLRLPAPLQTVLVLLRNDSYEQRLPIRMNVPADGISRSEITELAVETLSQLIAEAVGSAGSRVLSSVTGVFTGAGGDVPDIHTTFSFAAGSPLPDEADLREMTAALRADPTLAVVLVHELGSADVEPTAQLANPPTQLVVRTAEQLQRERDRLEAERAPIARDCVALYAAGKSFEAHHAHQRLMAIDTRLGELLQARERALDQLGDTKTRARNRRTRSAARDLSAARVDAAAALLRSDCPGLTEERIERRPGRGVPVEGLTAGGRVTAVLRRRAASAPEVKKPRLTRPERP